MNGNPVFRLKGDVHERLEVVEAEQCTVMPGTGLILERSGEGHRVERSLLAHILPDRGLDASTSQRRGRSFG